MMAIMYQETAVHRYVEWKEDIHVEEVLEPLKIHAKKYVEMA